MSRAIVRRSLNKTPLDSTVPMSADEQHKRHNNNSNTSNSTHNIPHGLNPTTAYKSARDL
jgi:hypothetical protein